MFHQPYFQGQLVSPLYSWQLNGIEYTHLLIMFSSEGDLVWERYLQRFELAFEYHPTLECCRSTTWLQNINHNQKINNINSQETQGLVDSSLWLKHIWFPSSCEFSPWVWWCWKVTYSFLKEEISLPSHNQCLLNMQSGVKTIYPPWTEWGVSVWSSKKAMEYKEERLDGTTVEMQVQTPK